MTKLYLKKIRALTLTATAIALLGLGACSTPNTPSSTSSATHDNSTESTANDKANATPLWQKITQHGTQIYGLARAGNWEKANLRLTQLKQRATQLKQDSNFSKLDLTQLDSSIQTLEQAVNTKNSDAAMRAANEVSFKTLTLAKQVQPSDLVNVMLLGYHTRKLDMATKAQDTTTASASAKDIQQTWQASRAPISTGANAEPAKQVDQLVQKLSSAQSIQDYQDVTPDLLKAERSLEKNMAQSEN